MDIEWLNDGGQDEKRFNDIDFSVRNSGSNLFKVDNPNKRIEIGEMPTLSSPKEGAVYYSDGGADPTVVPNQNEPIKERMATAGIYNNDTDKGVWQFQSWIKNTGTASSVAVHGSGFADISEYEDTNTEHTSAWGGNFVGYIKGIFPNGEGAFTNTVAKHNRPEVYGCEVDFGNLADYTNYPGDVNPGICQSWGFFSVSQGDNTESYTDGKPDDPVGTGHLLMAAAEPEDVPRDGIVFRGDGDKVSSYYALIRVISGDNGWGGNNVYTKYGIDFSAASFSSGRAFVAPNDHYLSMMSHEDDEDVDPKSLDFVTIDTGNNLKIGPVGVHDLNTVQIVGERDSNTVQIVGHLLMPNGYINFLGTDTPVAPLDVHQAVSDTQPAMYMGDAPETDLRAMQMNITSGTAGTASSYSFNIADDSVNHKILKIYGEANGSSGVQNLQVINNVPIISNTDLTIARQKSNGIDENNVIITGGESHTEGAYLRLYGGDVVGNNGGSARLALGDYDGSATGPTFTIAYENSGNDTSLFQILSDGTTILREKGTATSSTQYDSNALLLRSSAWDTTNNQSNPRDIRLKAFGGSGADGAEPYHLSILNHAQTEFVTFDPVDGYVDLGIDNIARKKTGVNDENCITVSGGKTPTEGARLRLWGGDAVNGGTTQIVIGDYSQDVTWTPSHNIILEDNGSQTTIAKFLGNGTTQIYGDLEDPTNAITIYDYSNQYVPWGAVETPDFNALQDTDLADPNADRIIFWDDSNGNHRFLTPGDGLEISTTTLKASVSDFAGTNLADDGTNNLKVDIANLQGDGLRKNSTNLAIDVSDFAGNGLADDGSENLKVDTSALTSATFNCPIELKESGLKLSPWAGIEDYTYLKDDADNILVDIIGKTYSPSGIVIRETLTVDKKLHTHGPTILGADTSAIADGDIGNGEVNIWVDETNNELEFKVKYSGGAVKSGTVALS